MYAGKSPMPNVVTRYDSLICNAPRDWDKGSFTLKLWPGLEERPFTVPFFHDPLNDAVNERKILVMPSWSRDGTSSPCGILPRGQSYVFTLDFVWKGLSPPFWEDNRIFLVIWIIKIVKSYSLNFKKWWKFKIDGINIFESKIFITNFSNVFKLLCLDKVFHNEH